MAGGNDFLEKLRGQIQRKSRAAGNRHGCVLWTGWVDGRYGRKRVKYPVKYPSAGNRKPFVCVAVRFALAAPRSGPCLVVGAAHSVRRRAAARRPISAKPGRRAEGRVWVGRPMFGNSIRNINRTSHRKDNQRCKKQTNKRRMGGET